MKNMRTWPKVILIFFSIVVVLRVGYIAFRGEIDKEYIKSANYDLTEAESISCEGASQCFLSNGSRLDSLELVFSNIAEDKVGFVTIQIYSGEELIYQTNIALANVNNYEWKKIYVNAELEKGGLYQIVFTPSVDCTLIPCLLVVNNHTEAEEIRFSSSEGMEIEGQYVINYGYLRKPGFFDRLSIISLWIIFWGIVLFAIVNVDNICTWITRFVAFLETQIKTQVLLTVLELVGCFIIIYSSGIEFQAPTKVILYLVSMIATVNYEKKFLFIKQIVTRNWMKVFMILTYFYAGFALVGQRILIYPLNQKLTTAGLFVFLCAVLWFVQIINSAFYYLECLREKIYLNDMRLKFWQVTCVYVCFLILPALYNLFANNPGITSIDTMNCMITQAKNLHGSDDWLPAFYCMVLRAIQIIWDSTYAVIIVQYFFWIYVCLELLLYLRKKGINEYVLIVLSLFLGGNAGNYITLNTIWKDIPYTLSMFWAIIILTKLLIDYEEYKRKWYVYLELIVSLVGISLYRKNGIVTYAIIIAFLGIILRKNAKVWASIATSFIIFVIIKGPVYTYFDIQPVESGMYIGLSQDILGVYYGGGEVSEDTLKMINIMTDYNNAEYNYTPTWSNQSYELNIEAKYFIVNYIDTFIKNPILMSRAIIDRVDAVWNIYAGKDSVLGNVNFTETMDNVPGYELWNEYYTPRHYVSLYTEASAASAYTASSQWISAIEWRCGLFTLLGVVSLIFLLFITNSWKYVLLYVPSFGHIMSLLLSTGWSDFRYFWPLNLLNLALGFYVLVITRKESMTAI